ncbi:hypothetical protein NPIL_20981 [Nephila pilipes]|uniref:Uncharacterized protein n=1 Tax=Nephila pilipes TaxID=299642 RepID=A0A8X6QFS4_NEPPI|nr:hypothetical protein NPIL_20981 [Nephila pilipes]
MLICFLLPKESLSFVKECSTDSPECAAELSSWPKVGITDTQKPTKSSNKTRFIITCILSFDSLNVTELLLRSIGSYIFDYWS